MKRFLRVGRERISVAVAALGGVKRINALAIVGGEVGDIVCVLEPPLDFECGDARLDQFLNIRRTIHVLQGKQVTLMNGAAVRVGKFLAVGIEQVVLHTAHLGAATPIGTAAENDLAQIAATRIGHTERSLHKRL